MPICKTKCRADIFQDCLKPCSKNKLQKKKEQKRKEINAIPENLAPGFRNFSTAMAVEPSGGSSFASSPVNGDKSSKNRVVSGPISDSAIGKICHQCRHKTRNFTAACKNQRNNRPCPIKLCSKCLLNRYGEKAEEVAALEEWSCPKCRGICNCSVCMKKRGHQPTGILINTAKATGFSSVSEMLLKSAERLNHENDGAGMTASLGKEVVFSPRKKGKENSFCGKLDANLPKSVDKNSKKIKGMLNGKADGNASSKIINQAPDKKETSQAGLKDIHDYNKQDGVLSNETDSRSWEKKPKKMKRERLGEMSNGKIEKQIKKRTSIHVDEKKPKKSRRDGLDESGDGKKDLTVARSIHPRKLKASKEMPNQGAKHEVDPEEDVNSMITVTEKDSVGTNGNDRRKKQNGSNAANVKNFLNHQTAEFHADNPLPVGTELTCVAGIDVRAEDVGNALQFLEFCCVFGKILDLRKGEAEYVLQDLLHSRAARRGKFSLTVQFNMRLLSVILTDQGEKNATISPSYGKNSWFHMLKKCLSGCQRIPKAMGVESLENAADYETLNASEKLRVLNLLCDEVLRTEKVRNWIDNQNTQVGEKIKEAKKNILAAKDKENSLKQKMKDDIAKAIIARGGAHLSSSEQEALVSHTKSEAAQAHAKMLESKGMLLKSNLTADAVRIEPVFMEHNGHVYWKLNCSGKSDVLHQNVGKGDTVSLDEKWSTLDAEGKEVIEKYISSLRRK